MSFVFVFQYLYQQMKRSSVVQQEPVQCAVEEKRRAEEEESSEQSGSECATSKGSPPPTEQPPRGRRHQSCSRHSKIFSLTCFIKLAFIVEETNIKKEKYIVVLGNIFIFQMKKGRFKIPTL